MNIFRRLLAWLLHILGFERKNKFRGRLYFKTQHNGWTVIPYAINYGCPPHHWSYHMNLDVKLGDTGTHSAIYAVSNLDGTHAEGVAITYASDNAAVCAVDATSGALTFVAVGGPVTITGTGTRGTFTHSDTGTVTIAQSDDFAGVLTLT